MTQEKESLSQSCLSAAMQRTQRLPGGCRSWALAYAEGTQESLEPWPGTKDTDSLQVSECSRREHS